MTAYPTTSFHSNLNPNPQYTHKRLMTRCVLCVCRLVGRFVRRTTGSDIDHKTQPKQLVSYIQLVASQLVSSIIIVGPQFGYMESLCGGSSTNRYQFFFQLLVFVKQIRKKLSGMSVGMSLQLYRLVLLCIDFPICNPIRLRVKGLLLDLICFAKSCHDFLNITWMATLFDINSSVNLKSKILNKKTQNCNLHT